MLKRLLSAVTILVFSMPAISHAQAIADLGQSINIRKSAVEAEKYTFEFCNNLACVPLGDANGYTAEEIQSFNGRFQWWAGGALLGAVEAVVIVFSGASGYMIAATSGYGLAGAVGASTAGLAVPSVAVSLIESINPMNHFRRGGEKLKVEKSLNKMIRKGEAAIVVYSGSDLTASQAYAERVDSILRTIR